MYSQIAANKRRTWLLLAGFIVFIAAFGYILSRALGSPGLFVAIFIGSLIYALVSYFASAAITVAMTGAKPIAKADAPELYRVVENLSITAGLPMPKVYIVSDSSPNAFATGRDPQHAIVAATTGLLEIMERDELEGVIAHELSHVGNYDIRLMAVVIVLVSVIALVANIFLNLSFWGGGDDDDGGNQIFFILGIVGAILAPIAATLIQLAINRRREYLADASGVLLTRYPEGLAKALSKLAQDREGMPRANPATSSLYIANPLRSGKGLGASLTKLFDTHPPLTDRIAKLRAMETHI